MRRPGRQRCDDRRLCSPPPCPQSTTWFSCPTTTPCPWLWAWASTTRLPCGPCTAVGRAAGRGELGWRRHPLMLRMHASLCTHPRRNMCRPSLAAGMLALCGEVDVAANRTRVGIDTNTGAGLPLGAAATTPARPQARRALLPFIQLSQRCPAPPSHATPCQAMPAGCATIWLPACPLSRMPRCSGSRRGPPTFATRHAPAGGMRRSCTCTPPVPGAAPACMHARRVHAPLPACLPAAAQALLNGSVDATLLNPPFSVMVRVRAACWLEPRCAALCACEGGSTTCDVDEWLLASPCRQRPRACPALRWTKS